MVSNNKNWEYDLDEYIREGEPDKVEKTKSWKAAIGLQDVDGLKTSSYLLDTAKEHIEGKIDIKTAKKRVESYYEERKNREKIEEGTKEADIVSARIAELLGERTFNFSPVELKNVHERIFLDIFESAGKYRDYNITKKEWVLNGATVLYASYNNIEETLNYDFAQEKLFSYDNLSLRDAIKHIAKFTSDIWQVHPFCEGNTRTTAVFIIKYLKTFGFDVNNETFAENSWYFRNALVRANYNDINHDIISTNIYLEYFFENLLLNANHDLKNRYLHIDYKDKVNSEIQSANVDNSKCKNCTLEEMAIINEIKNNSSITQEELAKKIGKSVRTIKNRTIEMQNKGLIKRNNGKRAGHWEIL